jgi:hypothetical protein
VTQYPLTVRPHGSLFIGGYAQAAGASDGDTACDGGGMLIPGSAVKGALRESALRLVNGVGRGDDLFTALFGTAELEGVLRVGPLRPRPESGEAADLPELSLRHHVSLERATRQAASGRLFQNRVTTAGFRLAFHGELTAARPLTTDELGLLTSAVALTDQLGGGRGRGLGLVTLALGEPRTNEPQGAGTWELPGDGTVTLILSAEEPLQLGVVKDLTNVHASKDYLDGSAVRGAVAASLARLGLDEALDEVLGGERPASFRNGYPGHGSAIPAPLTLRVPKKGGSPSDDALRLCAHAVGGLPFGRVHDQRAAAGSFAYDGTGWTRVRLQRRMITRTARNPLDGRAAHEKLFSLEVVEPTLEHSPNAPDGRLRFYVPVSGRREQLELVVRAAAGGLLVGGCRNRGFGRLQLCGIDAAPALEPLSDRHRRWCELLTELGVPGPERTGVLLAVGPVAVGPGRLQQVLGDHGLELRHGVSRRRAHGGWNQGARLWRTVAGCFVPGTTWIVETSDGNSALAALATLEERGVGPGRADGWGRLIACHPVHCHPVHGDCCEEDPKK